MAKNKMSKACDISRAVRQAVEERDGGLCVVCERRGIPNAHYICRAHGGKGVEENIVTLCLECHYAYDQTAERPLYREIIRSYLQDQYFDWDESKLVYKKHEEL